MAACLKKPGSNVTGVTVVVAVGLRRCRAEPPEHRKFGRLLGNSRKLRN